MLLDISGAVLARTADDTAIVQLAEAIRAAAVRLDMTCHIQIRDVHGNRQLTITEVPENDLPLS